MVQESSLGKLSRDTLIAEVFKAGSAINRDFYVTIFWTKDLADVWRLETKLTFKHLGSGTFIRFTYKGTDYHGVIVVSELRVKHATWDHELTGRWMTSRVVRVFTGWDIAPPDLVEWILATCPQEKVNMDDGPVPAPTLPGGMGTLGQDLSTLIGAGAFKIEYVLENNSEFFYVMKKQSGESICIGAALSFAEAVAAAARFVNRGRS